jgi:YHS domain-containing protein
VQKNESPLRRYDPVTLTLGNELVSCKDPRFAVEYKSRIYWLASAENTRLFLDDPESFLAMPLPEVTPYRLPLIDRVPPPKCALDQDGVPFCPVALVDRKELVKGAGCYIVQHQGLYYSMESNKSCEKFMRRPMRYVARAKLPAKRPALPCKDQIALLTALTNQQRGQDNKGLQPSEMLTFMQSSVAETICQALVEAGERRPLLPGKSAQESSLVFLARFLRAKNVLNTEMTSAEVKAQLDKFLSDCALPNTVKELTKRKEAFENSQEGVWTSSDTRQFQDLCGRFDKLFGLPA